ncbi:hypothetical protein [Nocardia concava]|uniref:hypothetical protein n=1 Tax=Nocardia concava TaxID=257281 RepID=UPI0002F79BDF|nr:hypothetical protein [Nocardia concava]
MITSGKAALATATLTFAALAAPLTLAAPAQADPLSGTCSGGQISFNTNPIGLSATPVKATVTGNLSGCQGTPSPAGTVKADFAGTGSCFDVNGTVDGAIAWANGQTSTFSGPYDVPGGAGAPKTNTVAITGGPGAGQQLTVSQGAVDGGPMVAPCLTDGARSASIAITSAQFG